MIDLVLHIPHSRTAVPPDIRPQLCPDETALAREILRITDHHTEALFGDLSRSLGATAVVFPVSRLVVDPERFEDDALEPMARIGMGVIYMTTSDGEALRSAPPTPPERSALLERFYRPHHSGLEATVRDALEVRRRCLVIDCHSFPARPLPYEMDQDPDRPDICLGTDEFHTPPPLLGVARQAFEAQGLRVAVNRPFAGALVPMKFHRKDARVSALMIEVNRRLYMDEATGEKLPAFGQIQQMLGRVLTQVSEELRRLGETL